MEVRQRVDATVTIKQIIENTPVPVIVEPEQEKRITLSNLRDKLYQLYHSVEEAVASISGRMAFHSQYISMSFQPKPVKNSISSGSFGLLAKK